jgi:hypothetical protein
MEWTTHRTAWIFDRSNPMFFWLNNQQLKPEGWPLQNMSDSSPRRKGVSPEYLHKSGYG